MNELCEKCKGKCCKGQIRVHSYENFDSLLTDNVDGKDYRTLKVDQDNVCLCLADGQCSIYNDRPIECRLFEVGSECCLAFVNGNKTQHKCDPCYITEEAEIFTETKNIKIEHYNSGNNLEEIVTECLDNSDEWAYFVNAKKLRVYFIKKDLTIIRTTRLGSIKAVSPSLVERLYQMSKTRPNGG